MSDQMERDTKRMHEAAAERRERMVREQFPRCVACDLPIDEMGVATERGLVHERCLNANPRPCDCMECEHARRLRDEAGVGCTCGRCPPGREHLCTDETHDEDRTAPEPRSDEERDYEESR